MLSSLRRYAHWLHTRWPAGGLEKLPVVREDGSTNVQGLWVVGDLTGIPLLKFSADTGARAVRSIVADPVFAKREKDAEHDGRRVHDLVIVGGGVSGFAAALEAQKDGLDSVLVEAAEPFSTIVNFPKGKPIYTYPTDMVPAGELTFTERSDVREGLIEELQAQTVARGIVPVKGRVERIRRDGRHLEAVIPDGESLYAHAVIVAIGRSGNYRKLGVEGEELDKVSNRLHDPADYAGRDVLVVGGGDSALETAVAVGRAGGRVTLSYRKPELSRPKPDNVAAIDALARDGRVELVLGSRVEQIRPAAVVVSDAEGQTRELPNDAVFSMIGREAPLDFFRRSGVKVRGDWTARAWLSLGFFLSFCIWLYHWKTYGVTAGLIDPARWMTALLGSVDDTTSLLYTIKDSASKPAFYYTLAYCVAVVVFGVRRIRRRKTPYVTVQTLTLMAIQVLPLFLLPELILPWLGRNGLLDGGPLGWLADQLFPMYGNNPAERAYWRAYGLILAWPLMIYNIFTAAPLWGWLVVGFVQTFVLIPLAVFKWGKGAYCGWICSCGALAETLGDEHRHKMPHGPRWNRLNLVGQAILALAFLMLGLRIVGWVVPSAGIEALFTSLVAGYKWGVDMVIAGILGVGLYFHFSGRVWCRFACPLAALMHIYALLGRFRILADKKKCISCNACTSVCHQGIDIMGFANKGLPMADPECVRCSACVAVCPTGVLSFGEVDRRTGAVKGLDSLAASPVLMAEAGRAARDPHGLRSAARTAAIVVAVLVAASGGLLLAQSRGGGRASAHPAGSASATQPASRPASRPAVEAGATQEPSIGQSRLLGTFQGPARVNHELWDGILERHVHGELVDYEGIRDEHGDILERYLDDLAGVDIRVLSRTELMVFYINLYNASMVQAVIDRNRPGWSPANDDFRIFQDAVVRMSERTISLDKLEKVEMLPLFREPRLHVALVCAARSCPPLLPRAYHTEDIEEVLETNMRRFINDGRRNRVDVEAERLELSQLFNWYADDFGGPEAVAEYVNRYYAGADVSGFTKEFIEYSWQLNGVAP